MAITCSKDFDFLIEDMQEAQENLNFNYYGFFFRCQMKNDFSIEVQVKIFKNGRIFFVSLKFFKSFRIHRVLDSSEKLTSIEFCILFNRNF